MAGNGPKNRKLVQIWVSSAIPIDRRCASDEERPVVQSQVLIRTRGNRMSKTANSVCLAMFLTLLALQGCENPEQQSAEVQFMEELRQSVDQGKAIANHDDLAEKLAIPRSRVQAIVVGPGAKTRLAGQLGGATLGYVCTDTSCTCTGDTDCNDMYTSVCKDPKTNGVCIDTGGRVTCSCQF